jgi:peptide/nickel transport system permease protein
MNFETIETTQPPALPVVGTAPSATKKEGAKNSLSLLIGGSIIGLWVLVTVFVPLIIGRSAEEVTYGSKLLSPSGDYLFGTDALGRDVLVRTAIAFRYDIVIALGSVISAAIIGVLLGALAGSVPEWLDNIEMGILDVVSAFPSVILALAMTAALGASISTLIFAIAVVLIPQYARATRSAILSERSKPYAEAARAMGLHPARTVLVHLLPNTLFGTLTQIALDLPTAIMIAAGLSFLGFGVQPPTAEWGLMINEGSSYIVSGQWWVTFFPGLAILTLVIAFSLLEIGIKRFSGRQ